MDRVDWQRLVRKGEDRQARFRLSPDGLLVALLILWWLLNLLQGAFTGLANDEAYYWSWVCPTGGLDWGYYDHPPMIAFLIWLTSWMGGALGIRFATLLLLPFGLYLLWRLIRPSQPSYREVWLYAGICFALPALQLYGLLALPDAPLIFASAVFLLCYNRFLQRQSMGNALLMGVAMALLAYSKYHGVLVVGFALLAHLRVFRSWRTYVALGLALLLYMPHLCWQWQHDWCSFAYHLSERHKGFDLESPLMLLVNLLVFFNPFFVWHIIKSFSPCEESDKGRLAMLRTMRFIAVGVALFFFVASWRGSTQIQWLLPMALPVVVLLFDYARRHPRCHRYLAGVSIASACLFLIVRIIIVVNPFDLKGELWNNEETYVRIAECAHGRPVYFIGYAQAAKYVYYTGEESSSMPNVWGRYSNWSLGNGDSAFFDRSVLIEVGPGKRNNSWDIGHGNQFHYNVADNYRPLTGVRIYVEEEPTIDTATDTLRVRLRIHNPYSFDLASGEDDSLLMNMAFRVGEGKRRSCYSDQPFRLPAGETLSAEFLFPLPAQLEEGCLTYGFYLAKRRGRSVLNSKRHELMYPPRD